MYVLVSPLVHFGPYSCNTNDILYDSVMIFLMHVLDALQKAETGGFENVLQFAL